MKPVTALVTLVTILSVVQLQMSVEIVDSGEHLVTSINITHKRLQLGVTLLVSVELGLSDEAPGAARLITLIWFDVVVNTQQVQLQLVTLAIGLLTVRTTPELLTRGYPDSDNLVNLDSVPEQR